MTVIDWASIPNQNNIIDADLSLTIFFKSSFDQIFHLLRNASISEHKVGKVLVVKITKINLSIKAQNIMGFIKGPDISDDEEKRNWKKNRKTTAIAMSLAVLGMILLAYYGIY